MIMLSINDYIHDYIFNIIISINDYIHDYYYQYSWLLSIIIIIFMIIININDYIPDYYQYSCDYYQY
jgi:hypothetical protein